jgi:hypothetical protein
MKSFKNTPKKLLIAVGLLASMPVLFSSCLKENNNNYYNPPVAYLAFFQASPDEPPLNFFLNTDRVNINPLNFGDGIGYIRAYTGLRTINFANAYTNGQILSDTATLYQNQNYSLFLANTAANPQILLLKDTLNQPASGSANIRFINLSPDAGAVDLAVQGGPVLVANKSFKGHSSFISETANSNLTLQVNQAGTSTVLATLPNTIFNAGTDYTIWLYGLSNTTVTGEKLGISIVPNARF